VTGTDGGCLATAAAAAAETVAATAAVNDGVKLLTPVVVLDVVACELGKTEGIPSQRKHK
jgi:hypothetical protein